MMHESIPAVGTQFASCRLHNMDLGKFFPVKCKILGFGIRNQSSTDKESVIQYQESGVHNVEFRIKDGLGFP